MNKIKRGWERVKWSYRVEKKEKPLIVRQNEKGEVTTVGNEEWISEKIDDIGKYNSMPTNTKRLNILKRIRIELVWGKKDITCQKNRKKSISSVWFCRIGITDEDTMTKPLPVIDLFAGPGGLGEGFAAIGRPEGVPTFDIRLSVEKNRYAYQTLLLRNFFRQFPYGEVPEAYYAYLRKSGKPDNDRFEELFECYPAEAEEARSRALHAELGKDNKKIYASIKQALKGESEWILIGGPPCQAYSIVGRSRNMGNPEYDAAKDDRQFLYVEYLKILAKFLPAVFIMENVKGLLSATINNQRIFEQMLKDLTAPGMALKMAGKLPSGWRDRTKYRIFSLVNPQADGQKDLRDFIVCMEKYGIPQARHRLILLGIREDIRGFTLPKLNENGKAHIFAGRVLDDLPPLRSGLSQETDNQEAWLARIKEAASSSWLKAAEKKAGKEVAELIRKTIERIEVPGKDRGAEFVTWKRKAAHETAWFHDPRMMGVCNHQTRIHIAEDLHRYLYAACYAEKHKRSPDLRDFPKGLLPRHGNISKAINDGHFDDRFHVLSRETPAATITSHLAKDGHYFIHPDPAQCRSITVREAARLQTFPDNYFFSGSRTQQYVQIGNAVPPLLAYRIAEIVRRVLEESGMIN